MIKEDIKQITDVKELQRLYIELNNETEKQDKEIERLKADYSQANDIIVEQAKEIERLNNIINELEKYLIEDNYKNEDVWCITTQEVLEKLQELKGVDKE